MNAVLGKVDLWMQMWTVKVVKKIFILVSCFASHIICK